MDRDELSGDIAKIGGLVYKAASLEPQEITDDELRQINKFTLSPVAADEVFTFKVTMCDNEIDRQFEWFTTKALNDFKKLYVGKTVIKDHFRKADNQVARIYSTELISGEHVTKTGEIYTQLVAHCYMIKTASNADLIAEVKGGIKKEVSVGCSVSSAICSICGTDNTKTYCPHWPGRDYDKEGGKHTCYFKLDGGRDAYELSLVAVPAQPKAGTRKDYTGTPIYEPEEKGDGPGEQQTETDKIKELDLSLKITEAFIFAQKQEEVIDE